MDAQVEYERRQILRLTKALSDLRANSEQDNSAAEDREAALRAQLARETKVRFQIANLHHNIHGECHGSSFSV